MRRVPPNAKSKGFVLVISDEAKLYSVIVKKLKDKCTKGKEKVNQ